MSAGLRLLILSDTKPGHLTVSLGVLKSLERLTTVQPTTVEVRLRLKFLRPFLRALLNHPGWTRRIPEQGQLALLQICYKIGEPRLTAAAGKRFDWVLSCGGDTSFLNAWLARLHNIENIYCSSLRGLAPGLFTVLIASRTGAAATNEILLPTAPAPVDRRVILAEGRQFLSASGLKGKKVWVVLIGGNGAGYRYDFASMELLARGVLALAERHRARLLVTTSRRTGLKLENALRLHLEGRPEVAHATFYHQRPEKVVAKFLGAADLVFCTADSGSMITEAMVAGKPVYAIEPDRAAPEPFYQAFLQRHLEAKHINLIPVRRLHEIDQALGNNDSFHLLERDPITELADKLRDVITGRGPCG